MVDLPKADQTIDARKLQCPMPILKAKKAIKTLQSGQILEILSDDEGSKEDFPRWTKRTGHKLLGIFDEADYSRYFIECKND